MNKGGVLQDTSCKVSNCFCIKGNTADEIKVEKTSTSYVLTKPNRKIHVHVTNGNLTIMPNNAHSKFEFRESSPEMIQDIAELKLAAVKIINKKEGNRDV